MLARPVHDNWAKGLASWTCPTDPSNSDSECDPCGRQAWGNWDHMACRGPWVTYTKEGLPGNGLVNHFHITDYDVEGPVPLLELCGFHSLREFDLDGGALTGSIPSGSAFASCFPNLTEIDLSYNQLSGEIPNGFDELKSLEMFKIEVNGVTGRIPDEFGAMTSLNWLRFAKNKMDGPIPASLSGTAPRLSQLLLDNNDFSGNLYALSNHSLISFTAHNNSKLCGMVPVGLRYAHGFNYYATGLGLPCADEAF